MLNAKKIKFIAAYLDGNNMTQSAMKAGYSRKTAYSQGSRLFKDAEIQEAIQQRANDLSEEALMSRDKYIKEIYKRYMTEKAPNVKRQWFEMLGNMLGFNAATNRMTPTLAIFQAVDLKREAMQKLGVNRLPKDIEDKIDANTTSLDDLPSEYKDRINNRLRQIKGANNPPSKNVAEE